MKRKTTKPKRSALRVGIVVPHIFMHRDILPGVIFSPATLALALAEGLQKLGCEVTLFTPGPVDTTVTNSTADLSYFERELAGRGDSYLQLLKKHPLTFVSLARQVQGELIARAYEAANRGDVDVLHVYTNEEDLAVTFARFCQRPVIFTHHDPFNFQLRYKAVFPKYAQLSWLSMSLAQRRGMPSDTNWVANIYHGLEPSQFSPNFTPDGDYVAYLGRLIEPKGVHLAIEAVEAHNRGRKQPLTLKLAGKHYAGHHKDAYWQTHIEPHLGETVEYVGHLKTTEGKQDFLGNARALLMPSTFEEPFGMVMLEAMACATPVIGLDSGAIPEVIKDGVSGLVVKKTDAAQGLAQALDQISDIDRRGVRRYFEDNFTLEKMCQEHLAAYQKLVTK